MMSALYSGATGMKTHDSGMSSISNNIANVNTLAYKQQYALFQDLFSQQLAPGSSAGTTTNQLGLGAQLAANRTVFTEGSFEPGSVATDLAIGGKGYFQVVDENHQAYYTRAGNFRFDSEGWLRTPAGMNVTGLPMSGGVVSGAEQAIRIDPNDLDMASSPPKATESMSALFSLPLKPSNDSDDPANPYFSMMQKWDGAVTNGQPYETDGQYDSAMPEGSYAYKQSLKVIDAQGNPREVTMYLDGVNDGMPGATYEYLLAADPADMVAEGGIPSRDDGMLMAGTITFGPNGAISDMTAFTPTGTDDPANRLSKWVPATMQNGQPQFTANFADTGAQTIGVDFGMVSSTNQWANVPASAAAVGTNATVLGGLDTATRAERHSTVSANSTGAAVAEFKQDGYVRGSYTNMEVTEGGVVRINYSNSRSADVYTIPLYRFTSEDGLRREGGNLYAATPDSGETFRGLAGANNFGKIQSSQLETSNVDMAREMVSLITMQRGFQMNSKSITTADQLLQKAMELKR